MDKYIVAFILNCFVVEVNAQSQILDSLKSLLSGTTKQERANLLTQLCYELVTVDDHSALVYGKEAISLSKEIGDTVLYVKSSRLVALSYRRLEQLDSSLTVLLNAIPQAKRCSKPYEAGLLFCGLGMNYIYLARFDLALQYNLEAYTIGKQIGSGKILRITTNNIGLIYYKLQNFKKALAYYERSLAFTAKDDSSSLFSANSNMSLCYSYLKKFSQAEHHLQLVNNNFLENDAENKGHFLLAKAVLELSRNQLDSADVYYSRVITLARKIGNRRLELTASIDLAEVCLQRERTQRGIQYLTTSERLISTSYNSENFYFYKNLVALYRAAGDLKNAFKYQDKYNQYRDSVFGFTLMSSLTKIENEFIEKQKNDEIASKNNLVVSQQGTIVRQRYFNILLVISILLLFGITVLIFNVIDKRRNSIACWTKKSTIVQLSYRSTNFGVKLIQLKMTWLSQNPFVN